jgi:uncharacterized protein
VVRSAGESRLLIGPYLNTATHTLVAGFGEYGLARLTAANYLRTQLDLEETGHVAVEELPAVTPFEDGTPRHHTRLFSSPDHDVTVVVGELFVPPYAADPFADAVLEYAENGAVKEVVVLSGVPINHGPDDHRAFYVASEDYRTARLDGDHGIPPVPGGFPDGINGALIECGLSSPLRTCVLTTPVHAQTPDADAALRLLEVLELDTGPLEAFAAVSKQSEELAARTEAQRAELESGPEDRMYV